MHTYGEKEKGHKALKNLLAEVYSNQHLERKKNSMKQIKSF